MWPDPWKEWSCHFPFSEGGDMGGAGLAKGRGNREVSLGCVPPMEMSSRQLNTRLWNIGQRSRSRCTFVSNPNIVGFEIQET